MKQQETFSCYECCKLGNGCAAMHPPNKECFKGRENGKEKKIEENER